MAHWISQNECSSISPATRRRTAYLETLRVPVRAAIEAYVTARPGGEEVTLEVLAALGNDALRRFARGRTFGRVKQDVGLLVAQTLVDTYGAGAVHTLRRDDRQSVSARRNTRRDVGWVGSYTPHRILGARGRPLRILLDTSVVRKIAYGDADALDVGALRELIGAHTVSIADGAVAEIAAALIRDSHSFTDWAKRVRSLDEVLDPDMPIAPGGRDLAALWMSTPEHQVRAPDARAYHREVWRYLRDVRSRNDLATARTFHDATGHRWRVQLNEEAVSKSLSDAGSKWKRWVDLIAPTIRSAGLEDDDLVRLIEANLALDMPLADLRKLDLVIRVMARRAVHAAAAKDAYSPDGTHNDALDLDLLFAIPLPAIVCVHDGELLELVRAAGGSDASAVVTPDELLARLRTEKGKSSTAL